MPKIIQVIGITGFILCLAMMQMTRYGERGIRKYDASFRLPDMQFHYSAGFIGKTFERIGEKGRAAYRRYLILDFCFIACFLITMLTITGTLDVPWTVRHILYAVCVLRALLDVVENTSFLILLSHYPRIDKNLAAVCSWITT